MEHTSSDVNAYKKLETLDKISPIKLLLGKLSAFKEIQEVYLFGSRARNDAQERSDIDIAIVCPNSNDVQWNEILKTIEFLPTLIKIDCIRFDNLQKENPLRQAIIRDKVILYQRGDFILDPVINESFQKTEKALIALENIVKKPQDPDRSNIDATIQRFEFTIELFWKLLKKLLLAKGVSTQYPRDVLQEAFRGNMIDDEQIWINMLNDRNQTSHTYDEDLADQIYKHIVIYTPIFRKTLSNLKEKFCL
jgi:nucleotidyltransferase substrate binding protein (TIGR01987 family)